MFEAEIRGLQEAFGEDSVLQAGDARHVRIGAVALPRGCDPPTTPVLLVLQPGARPAIYVKPVRTGPHGGPPRSCSEVLVNGEPWVQFSYQFPWEAGKDDLVKFVLTALRRFAKHE